MPDLRSDRRDLAFAVLAPSTGRKLQRGLKLTVNCKPSTVNYQNRSFKTADDNGDDWEE